MPLSKTCNSTQIRIRLDNEPDLDQLLQLYRIAGWMSDSDTTESLANMLRGSHAWCTAYDGDDKLIGFMRGISDGVSDAYLLDLIVHPDYRKNGIGKQIVNTLADHLKQKGIEWIVCIGVPGSESFYAKTNAKVMEGFTPYRFHDNT